MYKVTLKLRNDTGEDVHCLVPKGQIFENQTVDATGQNLAAARDYHLIIPAHSRVVAELEALCTNRTMAIPSGTQGKATIFRIADKFDNQQQLWDVMSSVRT